MPPQVTFTWRKDVAMNHMRLAAHRALTRLKTDAHNWWLVIVPVGKDTPKHKAGTLRDAWFAYVIENDTGVVLVFGAATPYVLYVELGTGKMAPRAPIRKTAGEVFPLLAYYLAEEVAA